MLRIYFLFISKAYGIPQPCAECLAGNAFAFNQISLLFPASSIPQP
jgi:hypothetical protein